MTVFDIYTFNLNSVKFKDNIAYFDNLLREFGLKYTDIGFCFRSDCDGNICDKAIRLIKSMGKYKKQCDVSALNLYPASEFQLSSVSITEKGNINLHIDRDHFDDFSLLLSKVPRPVNFNFMGVILDNINWDDSFESTPYFKPNITDIISADHKFRLYYSNSIRFIKEFDYGNKVNVIQVMIERKADYNYIEPIPQKFIQFCSRLGKTIAKSTEFIFSADMEAKLKHLKDTLRNSINKNKYYCNFSDLIDDYVFPCEKLIDSHMPIKNIFPKKILTVIGKKHSYQYKKYELGIYEFIKTNKHNHTFNVSFYIKPFSSLLSGDVSVFGHNFDLLLSAFPEIMINDEFKIQSYAEKAFEIADEIEENYSEKLYSYFGNTPTWFEG